MNDLINASGILLGIAFTLYIYFRNDDYSVIANDLDSRIISIPNPLQLNEYQKEQERVSTRRQLLRSRSIKNSRIVPLFIIAMIISGLQTSVLIKILEGIHLQNELYVYDPIAALLAVIIVAWHILFLTVFIWLINFQSKINKLKLYLKSII